MKNIKSMENLHELVYLLKRQLHERLEMLNLNLTPMHVRALKIISKKPFCSPADIAHLLNRDKAQVTRLVKVLIEQGFIEKSLNIQDKRSQHLEMTKKGHFVIAKIKNIDEEIFNKMTMNFSEQDLSDFQRIYYQLVNNLTEKTQ